MTARLGAGRAAVGDCCLFIVVQTEPLFERCGSAGSRWATAPGRRPRSTPLVGVVGLLLVLEATRRSIGWACRCWRWSFLAYAYFGSSLPDWLFPHRGYGVERIVAQTFLHSQGVFGTALRVMFVYVFLFVLFGALLKADRGDAVHHRLRARVLGGTPGRAGQGRRAVERHDGLALREAPWPTPRPPAPSRSR